VLKGLGYIKETPLEFHKGLSELTGRRVFLKREDLQDNGSFKLRGAAVNIAGAIAEGVKGDFVCASAGNHSQGFAMACKHFKRKGVVYMPATTPPIKVERTKYFGGEYVEIQLVGGTFDEAKAEAVRYTQQQCLEGRGAKFVPPFDDERTIAGAATIGVEILEQAQTLGINPDIIIGAIGGGGLLSGVSSYMVESSTRMRCIGVQPADAPSMAWQLHRDGNGKQPLSKIGTRVDGAAVKEAGTLTAQILAANQVKVTTVTDSQINCAWRLLDESGITAELAGTLPVAALLNMDPAESEETVVLIISGRNISPERIAELRGTVLPAEFPHYTGPEYNPGSHFTRSVAQKFRDNPTVAVSSL
jgi:threonine dehydratase